MAEPTLPYGDIPAWAAILISLVTIYLQFRQNTKSAQDKAEQKKESELQEEVSKENLTNLKRQLRAEQMIKDIDELLVLTVDYWTKSESVSSNSAIMIKSKSQDLAHRCNEYRSFLWGSASSDFSAIRRQITGGMFEVSSREVLPKNALLIKEASRKIAEFRIELRKLIDKLDNLK